MEWTKEQKAAIDRRGGNLFVSAAAGSGKTAVLANRVVKYAASGGSLDRLLIVTFTRLAASEMRERIGKLLPEAGLLDEETLRRQKLLLYKAHISTIDSFFGEIVRKNFKTIDILPDFRLIDTAEYQFIKSDVLTELLEERYSDYKDGFAELLRLFGGEGENEALSDQINKLYDFLMALPFPEDWAEEQKAAYNDPKYWLSEACFEILPEIDEFIEIYTGILDDCPFKEKDLQIIEDEFLLLKQLKALLQSGNWNSFSALVSQYEFARSPRCQDSDRTMLKYKIYRNKLKDYLAKPLFAMNEAVLENDLQQVKAGVFALIDTTLEYISRVSAEMKRKNAYSFDAIAHLALKLVVKRTEDGGIERTDYAKELAEMFDEVLIDEYQDVNDLQDFFFSAISRNNCFAVGDVKQSIYMFRHANPDNFTEKEGLFPVIYLNKNFRSRKGILDFCNFVFENLFSSRVGGLSYGSNEALNYAASYPERADNDVELHLLHSNDDEESAALQARFIARRIKRLIKDGFTVGNPARPATFSDFAVISRQKNDFATYERIFFEEGVPCCGTGGGSFLDSPETSTVFAFLKAIDNPYDDISLFATMFSPIGGFSADEIANIRLEDKKASLYTALTLAAAKNKHAAEFLDMLTKMRILSENFPVHRLVRQIYESTGYPSFVSCMPLGYLKKERLMSFYAFCRTFGERNGGSLYEFIRFTENVSSQQVKAPESTPSGNFVKIMTIHASKGLEFPIVIIPQLNKRFNVTDLSAPMITDISSGIATKLRDPEMIYEQTTFMYELMSRKKRRKLMSENLRLVYVAFTRAREKLILVSENKNYDEKMLLNYSLAGECDRVFGLNVIGASDAETLLLSCLTRHPQILPLITMFSDVEQKNREGVSVFLNEEIPEDISADVSDKQFEIPLSCEEILRRCSPVPKQARIPAKLSVTELVKNRLADEDSEQLISEPLINEQRSEEDTQAEQPQLRPPQFMLKQEDLSGAEAGTAIHNFMSVANLEEPTAKEAERLVKQYVISPKQAEAVIKNKRRIENFKSSDLYAKIRECRTVRKEEYFVSRIPASEFTQDKNSAADEIILQGAIDLLCETDDGLMIVDYKTDRADEKELRKRYEKQLEYYAYAAEKCFNKAVTGIYIWSFYLSKQIDLSDKKNTLRRKEAFTKRKQRK